MSNPLPADTYSYKHQVKFPELRTENQVYSSAQTLVILQLFLRKAEYWKTEIESQQQFLTKCWTTVSRFFHSRIHSPIKQFHNLDGHF